MLFDPARHEPLQDVAWDSAAALRTVERIVRATENAFDAQFGWPIHPLDATDADRDPPFNLYFGAGGVAWALHYLEAEGAIALKRSYADCVERFIAGNAAWQRSAGLHERERASYPMGETGLLLLETMLRPDAHALAELERLIAGNAEHPARELMWGAPGTMLAAFFLHERTRDARWAELYRTSARTLRAELQWSPAYQCHYWAQDMYGQTTAYLDAVHGFAATAAVLTRGRHLLEPREWDEWQSIIVDTVRNTAWREDDRANWPPLLYDTRARTQAQKRLMQFCHGAPGFVVCLGDLPTRALDDLLVAGGEATWAAGPLAKGSNLCHGTAGNGYALLRLYARTGDARWLARARAFAMHAIAQSEAHARQHGRMRYALWTGDAGLAIYLWHCLQACAAFPTLDCFFPRTPVNVR